MNVTRLVDRLPKREALAVWEIDARHASRAAVIEASRDFTRPLVVRGGLLDKSCLQEWGDRAWWLERYANAKVLSTSVNETCMLPLREAMASSRTLRSEPRTTSPRASTGRCL